MIVPSVLSPIIRIYYDRGWARFTVGNLAEAEEDLNRAVELNPNFAVAVRNRALVRQKMDQDELALEDYARLIGIDPSDLHLTRQVARFSSVWGRSQRLSGTLTECSKLDQDMCRFLPYGVRR